MRSRSEFFQALFQHVEHGQVNIRLLPSKKSYFLPLNMLSSANFPEDQNCYFTPCTRKGGGRKEDIVEIPCVWNDIDFKDTPRPDVNERLRHFPLRASALVETGGGYHPYWFLSESLGKEDIPKVEKILKRLAVYLGGDMAATDASRILRVPDTFNVKPEYLKPRPVKVVHLDPSLRYELDSFDQYLPELSKDAQRPTSPSSTTDSLVITLPKGSFNPSALTSPIPKGHRDEFIFHTAYLLAKGGAPANVVRYVSHLLATKCCEVPFSEKECTTKIKSALERAERGKRNLYADVRQWVEEASEYFTLRDLYSDLNLIDEKDKANARQAVKSIKEGGLIEQASKQGTYRKVMAAAVSVDVAAAPQDCLDIRLPFGLEGFVNINHKDLIVFAGSPNSGKTAIMLETVRLNMHQRECYYWSTEMGAGACRRRLEKHESLKVSDWRWHFHEEVPNYEHIIRPDDLNFIDYVEELEGESYKIPGILAKIQRRLKNGVAFVALQKKTGTSHGIGGEMTRAKPALFCSIEQDFPGNVFKVIKAKDFDGENPNGMYLKFKIVGGINLIKTLSWDME